MINLEAKDCFVKGAEIQGLITILTRSLIKEGQNFKDQIEKELPQSRNSVVSFPFIVFLPLETEGATCEEKKNLKCCPHRQLNTSKCRLILVC